MSGILSENLVPFTAAGAGFPGRRVSASTLHRWRLAGVRNASGERVKLETAVVGGQRFTSLEAIARFLESLNSPGQPAGQLTPEQRQARSAVARAELAARGI